MHCPTYLLYFILVCIQVTQTCQFCHNHYPNPSPHQQLLRNIRLGADSRVAQVQARTLKPREWFRFLHVVATAEKSGVGSPMHSVLAHVSRVAFRGVCGRI